MTARRTAIIAALSKTPAPGATAAELCAQINQPSAMVRPAIIALVQRETIDRTKGGYFMRPPAPHALRPDPNKHQPIAGARVHVNAAMPNGTQEYWAAQRAWGRRP